MWLKPNSLRGGVHKADCVTSVSLIVRKYWVILGMLAAVCANVSPSLEYVQHNRPRHLCDGSCLLGVLVITVEPLTVLNPI